MEFSIPSVSFEATAVPLFLIFVRVSAMTFFLPGFGESYVPARIKLVIAVSLSLLVYPMIRTQFATITTSGTMLFRLILTEATVGVFWGMIIRMIIFCLQIAGAVMSQATSLAQIFGGTASMDAQPAMGHILVVSGIALLCILGLHEAYIVYILNTYAVVPAGALFTGADVAAYSGHSVARAFALAFQLAAAALTATLLYNIILGVINRAMPQLLVSFVGAPAITAGGLFILFVMAPSIMQVWLEFAMTIISIPEIS